MYSNTLNYDNPWSIIIDPTRQGFQYVPVNGILCEYLNINTMLPLFFDPVNMMNVENNRKIAEFAVMGQEFPKMRISGFNKRSAPILDEMIAAQEERVKIDQEIAKEGYLVKERLKRKRMGLLANESPNYSKYLPNTQQFQYTQAWYPPPGGYIEGTGYPNPMREGYEPRKRQILPRQRGLIEQGEENLDPTTMLNNGTYAPTGMAYGRNRIGTVGGNENIQ